MKAVSTYYCSFMGCRDHDPVNYLFYKYENRVWFWLSMVEQVSNFHTGEVETDRTLMDWGLPIAESLSSNSARDLFSKSNAQLTEEEIWQWLLSSLYLYTHMNTVTHIHFTYKHKHTWIHTHTHIHEPYPQAHKHMNTYTHIYNVHIHLHTWMCRHAPEAYILTQIVIFSI